MCIHNQSVTLLVQISHINEFIGNVGSVFNSQFVLTLSVFFNSCVALKRYIAVVLS